MKLNNDGQTLLLGFYSLPINLFILLKITKVFNKLKLLFDSIDSMLKTEANEEY